MANLRNDLNEMKVGETLDLETFGGGKYKSGNLMIEKVDQNHFTITEFVHPDYFEDEGGYPLDDGPEIPEHRVSHPMNIHNVISDIGEFAY